MVIALDRHKKPLGFVTERRCRKLLEVRRAVFYRHYPAVIILKDVDARNIYKLPSYRIKIDPGAVHTGIAIVCNETNEVMYFLQIEYRGSEVKKALITRKQTRRNRRSRETRYRRCKFKNGGDFDSSRKNGWLPPSVKSTADNVIHWVEKLCRYINITECSFEAVRFDSQLMDNPEIGGEEYQQGTLSGYELREYLMEHFRHTCQYCGGESGDPVLEWEHKIPRSRGGSDSVKNASLACSCCNRDKGNRTLEEYLEDSKHISPKGKSEKALNEARISHISGILEKGTIYGSNRYSAWVNSTRRYIEKYLFLMFDDVECCFGGRTKYNRIKLKLPKDHHYDALCVGSVPKEGYTDRTNSYVLYVKATGRGTRFRGQCNSCGVITVKYKNNSKRKFGFQTGDIVQLNKPKGKDTGQYTGKVAVRSSGSFDLIRKGCKRITANYKYFRMMQYSDGYEYLGPLRPIPHSA